jgi:hypothetical protein
MKAVILVVAVLFPLAGGGCHKELNAGRCNTNNDCPTGQRCDLAMNGVCVCDSPSCPDGGTAGTGSGGTGGGTSGSGGSSGGSGGGGQSGDAGQGCQPACAAPRSICAPNLTCVECVSKSDCTIATKPICDSTGICISCTSDDQCVTSSLNAEPGVCMAHQDGRCATVEETIYVQKIVGTCSDTVSSDPGVGTAARPLCSMEPVTAVLSTKRDLVVVRGTVTGASWRYDGQGPAELSVIGQQTAFISSADTPAFAIQSGAAYLRSVKLASSAASAIEARGGTIRLDGITASSLDPTGSGLTIQGAANADVRSSSISNNAGIGIRAIGGTVTLNKVTVDSCAGGGILLDGAAFDIRNTTVTRNGSADDMGTPWGGMRIKNPSASGSKQINLSTVRMNDGGGVSCTAAVDGSAVLVSDNINTPAQISPTCVFMSCGSASSTCGAQ